MEFLVLDFEIACRDKSSICQAGLVKYDNGEIITLIDEYINPLCEFDIDSPWFNKLHHISAVDVKDSLSFEEFYPKLKALIENKIVFNYNGSDEQFLKAACEKYNLEYIKVKWLDPLSRIQITWKGLKKHKLEIVADYLEIDYKPHNAAQDSMATAKVIAITSIVNDYSVEDWESKLVNISSTNIHNSTTTNSEFQVINEDYLEVIKQEGPSILEGRTVVCTCFSTEKEKEFFKGLVEVNGGKATGSISQKTTNLIVRGSETWPAKAHRKKAQADEWEIEVMNKDKFLELVKYTGFID
jgi:DNA polymerase-3 subunit epsilon